MSRINHRTHFSCKKSHKNNPQMSEIICYVCYSLQNVIIEIDFNKLCTFTSQSCKRLENHQILQHFLGFGAVLHSLKHENSIFDM